MNTTTLSLSIVLATAAVTTAQAQALTPAQAAAATAPRVTMAPAAAPAAAVTQQVVHTPRLPTGKELSEAAAAQGLTLERIEPTDVQVLAVFRAPNGSTNTVVYQVMPPAGTPATQTVVTERREVIYRPAPRVIYYDDFPRYSPYPYRWYPPVSVHLGVGYGRWGGRGHYHR